MNFKEKIKILFSKKNKSDFFNKLFILFLVNDKIYKILLLISLLSITMLIILKINSNYLTNIFYNISILTSLITILSGLFYKNKDKKNTIYLDKSNLKSNFIIIKLKYNEIEFKIYFYNEYEYYLFSFNNKDFYKIFDSLKNIQYYDIVYSVKDKLLYDNLDDDNIKTIKYNIKKSISYKRKLKLKCIN